MARKPRRLLDAPYLHVVNRGVRRAQIFIRREDYRAFLTVLQQGLQRHPVELLSYCLLPNHWHLVVAPTGTAALIDFMHWVTTTHAVRWHHKHQSIGRGPVYQGRYHATAIEAPDLLVRVCRYVERNALAAGIVARAEHWPWCSLAARARGSGDLPLKQAPFLTSSAWLDYVNGETEVERIAARTTAPDWHDVQYRRRPRVGPRPVPEPQESVEKRSVPLPTVSASDT